MKRRDLLKYVLAAPAIPAVATASSYAGAPPLTEESLEQLLKQIGEWSRMTGKPIAMRPNQVHLFGHRWTERDICARCGTTAIEAEEFASPYCYGHLAEGPAAG